jgi:hypothetical protein
LRIPGRACGGECAGAGKLFPARRGLGGGIVVGRLQPAQMRSPFGFFKPQQLQLAWTRCA